MMRGFFLETPDFNTRLIRAVNRYRLGLTSGDSEEEFIKIFKERRIIEDAAYVFPTKVAARVVIDNSISPEELEKACVDDNIEIRQIAIEMRYDQSVDIQIQYTAKHSRNL
ncbi:MAG: hypothetical protein ACYSSI_12175 [Planctomycetota bacterium]